MTAARPRAKSPRSEEANNLPKRAALKLYRNSSGAWKLVVTTRRLLASRLGEPLLAAFCRCSVHIDRLNGINALMVLSAQQNQPTSVAYLRDMQVLMWYAMGVLSEFRIATDDLSKALRQTGMTPSSLAGWRSLQALNGWSRSDLLRRLRNKIAFHVDPGEVAKGVRSLVAGRRRWVFATGDNHLMTTIQFPFGVEAALKSLSISKRDMLYLMKGTLRRQKTLPTALQELFVAALERKNLKIA
jgi:hypothetical protein